MIRPRRLSGSFTDQITTNKWNEVVDAIFQLQAMTPGPWIKLDKGGAGMALSLTSRLLNRFTFTAEITVATVADGPAQNRWKYEFKEVYLAADGYDNWTTLSNGRTSDAANGVWAYNTIEDMNTKTGGVIEGNGVDPDHLDTALYTSVMMPCTVGNIVMMHQIPYGGQTSFWFSYENGIDGECD